MVGGDTREGKPLLNDEGPDCTVAFPSLMHILQTHCNRVGETLKDYGPSLTKLTIHQRPRIMAV